MSRPEPHVETVELLVQRHPAAAEMVDHQNKRPIHYAEKRHRPLAASLMSTLASGTESDDRREN